MSDQNKAAMQRVYRVLSTGNLDEADSVIAEYALSHEVPPEYPSGLKGWKLYFTDFRASFPDLHFQILDTIAEGDTVVCRCIMKGTHQGDFMGIPSTGKKINVDGVDIARFRDGKAVEHWAYYDELGMMRQLGVIAED